MKRTKEVKKLKEREKDDVAMTENSQVKKLSNQCIN